MIFLVVGTQEPFDRLVQYVDEWSFKSGFNDIFAQVSNSKYKSKNFESVDFIPPLEFDIKFQQAELIIGHSGMGTIISALQHSKPIIVMPRLAKFREHRNDHQLATARSFEKLGLVKSVYCKDELFAALDDRHLLKPSKPIDESASKMLIDAVSEFIYH